MAKKEPRIGRQTPTKSIVLPYTETRGQGAIDLYAASGRTAQEWQELLIYDLLAVNILVQNHLLWAGLNYTTNRQKANCPNR